MKKNIPYWLVGLILLFVSACSSDAVHVTDGDECPTQGCSGDPDPSDGDWGGDGDIDNDGDRDLDRDLDDDLDGGDLDRSEYRWELEAIESDRDEEAEQLPTSWELCQPCPEGDRDDSWQPGMVCAETPNGRRVFISCGTVCEGPSPCPGGSQCVYPTGWEQGIGICDNESSDCLAALTPPEVDVQADPPGPSFPITVPASSGIVCEADSDCAEGEICDNSRMHLPEGTATAEYGQPSFTCRRLCYNGQPLDNLHYIQWSGNPNGVDGGVNPIELLHACRHKSCGRAACASGETCTTIYKGVIQSEAGSVPNRQSYWLASVCLPDDAMAISWTCPLAEGGLIPEPQYRHDWPLVADGCVSSPLVLPVNHDFQRMPGIAELDDGRLLIAGLSHIYDSFTVATLYDSTTHRYKLVQTRSSRLAPSVTRLASGEFLVVGEQNHGVNLQNLWRHLRTTEIFDPVTLRFREGPLLSAVRDIMHRTIPWKGGVLVMGGVGVIEATCQANEIYRQGPFMEWITPERATPIAIDFPYSDWERIEVAQKNDGWLLFGGMGIDGLDNFVPDFNYILSENTMGEPELSDPGESGLKRSLGDFVRLQNGKLIWFGGFEAPGSDWQASFPMLYTQGIGWEIISDHLAIAPVYGNRLVELPDNRTLIFPNINLFVSVIEGAEDDYWKENGYFVYDPQTGSYYQNRLLPIIPGSSSIGSAMHRLKNGMIVVVTSEKLSGPSVIQLYCPMAAPCFDTQVAISENLSWK